MFYLSRRNERSRVANHHRVPFEVDGEPDLDPENFMLLCASANRAKSWSCEHCENWMTIKDKSICLSCYWAYPENYEHIAMQQVRRVDLLWESNEIEVYEQLKQRAIDRQTDLPEFIKEILQRECDRPNPITEL